MLHDSDKTASDKTGAIQLGHLKKTLSEKFSSLVEVIFTASESHQELEAGFFQLLSRRFENKILSFYMSFINESTVDAWIECGDLTEELKIEVDTYFKGLLEGATLKLGKMYWLESQFDLPSIPVLLRLIKTLQPIKIEELSDSLKESYPVIENKWLKNKLDTLRRKKLLIWQKPGFYALTSLGLNLVPTGTRRSSSDVARALDLGRRKW